MVLDYELDVELYKYVTSALHYDRDFKFLFANYCCFDHALTDWCVNTGRSVMFITIGKNTTWRTIEYDRRVVAKDHQITGHPHGPATPIMERDS